jgi:hypothetical protein
MPAKTSSDRTDVMTTVLASIHTESGANLLDLTQASPVLLVFLRHFGCSFCRKTISDIAELRPQLEQRGVRPVFVHLGTSEIARAHFDYYGIGEVERVNDPSAAIYRHPVFALGQKNPFGQALNPAVWIGWLKGPLFKHGIGMIQGDGHQMPGIFFLDGPRIARRFLYRTIADEPDYLKLIT